MRTRRTQFNVAAGVISRLKLQHVKALENSQLSCSHAVIPRYCVTVARIVSQCAPSLCRRHPGCKLTTQSHQPLATCPRSKSGARCSPSPKQDCLIPSVHHGATPSAPPWQPSRPVPPPHHDRMSTLPCTSVIVWQSPHTSRLAMAAPLAIVCDLSAFKV